ncbi:MAG: ACP S-malonyltransferase [Pseudomonadota bacterium]
MSSLVRAIRKLAVDGDTAHALFPGGASDHLDSDRASQKEIAICAVALAGNMRKTVDPGTCVVLALPHGADFVSAFLACCVADVVAVPATPRAWPADTQDADMVWAHYQMCASLGRQCIVLCDPAMQYLLSASADAVVGDIKPLNSFLKEIAPSRQAPRVKEAATAVLLWTSGSEGRPKGVPLSHGNIWLQARAGQVQWSVKRGSRPVSWLSPNHNFGLHFGALVPFLAAAPCRVMTPQAFTMRPGHWVRAIADHCGTHLAMPNFAFDLCCDTVDVAAVPDMAFADVSHVVCGGEPLQFAAANRFFDHFARLGALYETLQPHYGMSECGSIATLHAGRDPFIYLETDALAAGRAVPTAGEKRGTVFASVGQPPNGLAITIWDHDRNGPLADGQIGEIFVTSDAVMADYWSEDEHNRAETFLDLANGTRHAFRTGDLGFVLDGQLCVTGRSKDVIIQHGKKYYPASLENTVTAALMTQFAVACAVITVSEQSAEEVILVLGLDASSATDNAARLAEEARKAVSEVHHVKLDVVVVVDRDAVFGSATSKLKRGPIKAAYRDGKLPVVWRDDSARLPPPEPAAQDHSSLISKLREQAFRPVLGATADTLAADSDFGTVGLTSLQCARIAGAIEDTFDCDFSPSILFVHTTLRQVARYLTLDVASSPSDQSNSSNKTHPAKAEDAIAIVGLHCDIPAVGPGVDAFWDLLSAGKNGVGLIADHRPALWAALKSFAPMPEDHLPRYAGLLAEIDHFDAEFFGISRREAECMDPQQRKVLQFIWDLAEVSGQKPSSWDGERIGLFVGAHSKDYADLLAARPDMMVSSGAYIDSGTHLAMIPNRASRWFNLKGPSEVINTACSSSLVALHHAANAVRGGDCTSALVLGVNLISGPVAFLSSAQAGMLSKQGACRTLDASADGFVRSEALAGVILKPLLQALADGDTVHGILRATAINHDGRSNSLRAPNGGTQRDLIHSLYAQANVDPASVSFVELHGTGTVLGDPIEVHALSDAFRQLDPTLKVGACPIGSVKSNIGHTEAAAGLVGLIKVLLCMRHKTLVKTPNLTMLNPNIDFKRAPFRPLRTNEPWHPMTVQSPLRAGISSFGFGGVNAHAIVDGYEAARSHSTSNSAQILILSAKTEAALTERVRQLLSWLDGPSGKHCTLPAVAQALQLGREEMAFRLGLVTESVANARQALQTYLESGAEHTGIIRGSSVTQPTAFHALLADDTFSKTMQAWIANGNLGPILELWVQGLTIDWSALWPDCSVAQTGLPGYPFATDPIWLPQPPSPVSLGAAPIAVPTPTEIKAPVPHTASSDLAALVLVELGAFLKARSEEINQEAPFAEIGLDSVGIMNFSEHLNQVFGWDVSPTVFYEQTTTKEFLDYVRRTFHHSQPVPATPPGHSKDRTHISTLPAAAASRSIAIIGMSGAFPQSPDISAFWHNLSEGRDCISSIPSTRWGGLGTEDIPHAGILDDIDQFDPTFFGISPREALSMDPQQRLLLTHCWQALEDAGYAPTSLAGSNTAVIVGSERSGYTELLVESGHPIESYSAIGMVASMGPNRVSHMLDFHGPSEPIETACSSSLVAIQRSVELLRQGVSDLALVGGVNTLVSKELHTGFTKARMLSPDGSCKTFSADANGYVRGEGVGILVLKPLSSAEADGDSIYGTIEGAALNHGGKSASLTAPNPRAQAELIDAALKDARWNPKSVSYLELHGTGTPLGDPIEFEGLRAVYGADRAGVTNACGLGSVKTNIGHLELAAGVAGVIKVLMQMRHKTLVPSLHNKPINPKIDMEGSPFYVVDEARPWAPDATVEHPLRAGVSSFGAGGVNAHVLLQDYTCTPKPPAAPADAELVVLSARSPEQLTTSVRLLLDCLSQNDAVELSDLAHTLQVGREHRSNRLAIIARSTGDLQSRLKQVLANELEGGAIFAARAEATRSANPAAKWLRVEASDTVATLRAAAKAWVDGADIDWADLRSGQTPRRIHLPPSPFAMQRFWPQFDQNCAARSLEAPPTDLVLKALTWEPLDSAAPEIKPLEMKRRVILLGHGDALPQIPTSLSVVALAPIDGDVALTLIKAIGELTALIQSELDNSTTPTLLQLVVPASGQGRLLAAVDGWFRAMHQERPNLFGQVFAVDPTEAEYLDQRLQEVAKTPAESYVAWNAGAAARPIWSEIPQSKTNPQPWIAGGTYLITGGLGGLGYAIAQDICGRASTANVILVGRSPLSSQMSDKLEELRKLDGSERMGKVEYHAVDITDGEALDRLIGIMVHRYGGLTGIVHTAGVIRDSLIHTKTSEDIQAVLAAKVAGTRNLDAATQNISLDLFVCFSSLVAILGNIGQTDYAAANSFLDHFAAHRETLRAQGLRAGRTVSINWPVWDGGGMQIDASTLAEIFDRTGLVPLPIDRGLNALKAVLATDKTQVLVAHGDTARFEELLSRTHIANAPQPQGQRNTVVGVGDPKAYLVGVLAKSLDLPIANLDLDENLEVYGLNSLMIMKLIDDLELVLGPLPKSLFYEHSTLRGVVTDLLDNHCRELRPKEPSLAAPAAIQGNDPMSQREAQPVTRSGTQMPIAIIGIAGTYPGAPSLDKFWSNLQSGVDSIIEVPNSRWDHSLFYDHNRAAKGKTYGKWGGFIEGYDQFDPLLYNISPRDARLMDPQERLFLQCVDSAIEDSGYIPEALAGSSPASAVGVFAGAMYSEYQLFGAQEQVAGRRVALNGILASIANRVSYCFDFRGPSVTVDTMCSSSLAAVHMACQALDQGECAVAIAGGVNLSLHPNKYLGLAQGNFLSTSGRCKSFGAGGDGYVPAEGVGAVILKPLNKALLDKDSIYAVIRGSAINNGGKTNGYSVPNPNAQAEVIRAALDHGRIDPASVSYVEAHGTGTALGDPIEVAGLMKVYGTSNRPQGSIALGSVKSNIGHCEAAAGIAALTKVILQFQARQIAPSLHAEILNKNIEFGSGPFQVQTKLSPWEQVETSGPRRAGISSFGAGGTNVHAVVEEWVASAPQIIPTRLPASQAFVLSAQTPKALKARARDLLTWMKGGTATLEQIAFTLQTGRRAMSLRLAWVSGSREELMDTLLSISNGTLENRAVHTGDTRSGRVFVAHLLSDPDQPRVLNEQLAARSFAEPLAAWVQGVELNWGVLYPNEIPQRLHLPTYRFAQDRYWAPRALTTAAEPSQDCTMTDSDRLPLSETDPDIAVLRAIAVVTDVPLDSIEPDAPFREYGVDSIHALDLHAYLCEVLQVELSPSAPFDFPTAATLAEHLRDLQQDVARHDTCFDRREAQIGLRQMRVQGSDGCPVSLFYPTRMAAQTITVGGYSFTAAINSKPDVSGVRGLILISHGFGGTGYSHHALARHLVSEGYLVATPHHTTDTLHKEADRMTPADFDVRTRQLRKTIELITEDPDWAALLHDRPIVAVGHSGGGATILSMLGAAIEGAPTLEQMPETRLSAAVLMAPMAISFSPKSLSGIATPLLILTAERDEYREDPRSEGFYLGHMPNAEHQTIRGAGHFSFMSLPSADSVQPSQQEFSIKDPDGFDRIAFERTNHAKISTFISEKGVYEPTSGSPKSHRMDSVGKAVVFPGQGSQAVGMGAALFENDSDFADQEQQIDSILGFSVRDICLNGPKETLDQTRYTQPCLYVLNALHYAAHIRSAAMPTHVAGHSLGEYNALLVAGVFDFFTGLKIVKARADAMSQAKDGAMAAVIGLDAEQVAKALDRHHPDIDIANLNAQAQIVISGPKTSIEKAKRTITQAGAKQYIVLPVSAAFHSRYMQPAARVFAEHIAGINFAPPRLTVISNLTASEYPQDSDSIRSILSEHLFRPVLWTQTISALSTNGPLDIVEIGHGKTLTRLIAQIQGLS